MISCTYCVIRIPLFEYNEHWDVIGSLRI